MKVIQKTSSKIQLDCSDCDGLQLPIHYFSATDVMLTKLDIDTQAFAVEAC